MSDDDIRARADQIATRTKAMLVKLLKENRELSQRVHELKIMPLPASDDPGYQLWKALMEDLREEGLAHLTIKHRTELTVTYEPVA